MLRTGNKKQSEIEHFSQEKVGRIKWYTLEKVLYNYEYESHKNVDAVSIWSNLLTSYIEEFIYDYEEQKQADLEKRHMEILGIVWEKNLKLVQGHLNHTSDVPELIRDQIFSLLSKMLCAIVLLQCKTSVRAQATQESGIISALSSYIKLSEEEVTIDEIRKNIEHNQSLEFLRNLVQYKHTMKSAFPTREIMALIIQQDRLAMGQFILQYYMVEIADAALLQQAIRANKPEFIKLLLQHGIKIAEEEWQACYQLASAQHIDGATLKLLKRAQKGRAQNHLWQQQEEDSTKHKAKQLAIYLEEAKSSAEKKARFPLLDKYKVLYYAALHKVIKQVWSPNLYYFVARQSAMLVVMNPYAFKGVCERLCKVRTEVPEEFYLQVWKAVQHRFRVRLLYGAGPIPSSFTCYDPSYHTEIKALYVFLSDAKLHGYKALSSAKHDNHLTIEYLWACFSKLNFKALRRDNPEHDRFYALTQLFCILGSKWDFKALFELYHYKNKLQEAGMSQAYAKFQQEIEPYFRLYTTVQEELRPHIETELRGGEKLSLHLALIACRNIHSDILRQDKMLSM